MINDRTPPQDVNAERSVLGACMLRNDLTPTLNLKGRDFYRPAHETIWQAITGLIDGGDPADWVSVTAYLQERGELERVGGFTTLQEINAEVIIPENASHWAEIVRDRSGRRRLIEEHTRNLQDAYESADPVEAIIGRAEERIRSVPAAEPMNVGSLMSFDEFCDQPIPDDDWIIPGLLDRGDRLVLTGVEGLGKTILMRQIAVCAAAGIHPFTYRPVDPMTVLFVDAENPKKIMVNSFSDLRSKVRANRGPIDEKRLWIERIPAGINLAEAADRLWLQRLVALVNPDLLCIGPAYKLNWGSGRDRDEDLARQVTSSLDAIRESVGCALVLEHHSPHGDSGGERGVRPIGSSLWLRWPEFGMGIRPAKEFTKESRLVDLMPWRGARDERDWPTQLAKGTSFMPWMDASYT